MIGTTVLMDMDLDKTTKKMMYSGIVNNSASKERVTGIDAS